MCEIFPEETQADFLSVFLMLTNDKNIYVQVELDLLNNRKHDKITLGVTPKVIGKDIDFSQPEYLGIVIILYTGKISWRVKSHDKFPVK